MIFQLYCKLIASVGVWIKTEIKFPSLPRLIRLVCMGNLSTDKRFPVLLAGGTHLLQVLIGQYEFLLVF